MKEKSDPDKCHQVKFSTLYLSPSIHHCNHMKLLGDSKKDCYDTYHTMNESFAHTHIHIYTVTIQGF